MDDSPPQRPEGVELDKIEANLDEGVLRVRVPKTAGAQAKKIAIHAGKALQPGTEEPKKGEAKKAA